MTDGAPYFFRCHRTLVRSAELLNSFAIASKILLASNENDGQSSTEMHNFGNPLRAKSAHVLPHYRLFAYFFLYIVKGIWAVDSEADQDDMRIGIGEWTKTIIVFLSGGIPKSKFDMLAIHFYVCNVVFKHGGDVDL